MSAKQPNKKCYKLSHYRPVQAFRTAGGGGSENS